MWAVGACQAKRQSGLQNGPSSLQQDALAQPGALSQSSPAQQQEFAVESAALMAELEAVGQVSMVSMEAGNGGDGSEGDEGGSDEVLMANATVLMMKAGDYCGDNDDADDDDDDDGDQHKDAEDENTGGSDSCLSRLHCMRAAELRETRVTPESSRRGMGSPALEHQWHQPPRGLTACVRLGELRHWALPQVVNGCPPSTLKPTP